MPDQLKHGAGPTQDSIAHRLGMAAEHHRLYSGTVDGLLMSCADESAARHATIKEAMISLSLADNLDDVNEEIKVICKAFDLPEPEWDENRIRYRFAWEEEFA